MLKGDYQSLAFLASAFKGIDAVIVTAGTEFIKEQGVVVEAAAKAGVRRIVPSEFGSVGLSLHSLFLRSCTCKRQ